MDYELIILIIMCACLILTYLHKKTRIAALYYVWLGLKLAETQVQKLRDKARRPGD